MHILLVHAPVLKPRLLRLAESSSVAMPPTNTPHPWTRIPPIPHDFAPASAQQTASHIQPRDSLIFISRVEQRIAVSETGVLHHSVHINNPAHHHECQAAYVVKVVPARTALTGRPDYFEFTWCVALLPGWCWPAFRLKDYRTETHSCTVYVRRYWHNEQLLLRFMNWQMFSW